MVRALLAGTKTQTRRAIKNQPPPWVEGRIFCERFNPAGFDKDGEMRPGPEVFGAYDEDGYWGAVCPYGQPGDRLWVREALFWSEHEDGWCYQADNEMVLCEYHTAPILLKTYKPAIPSIHMPRAASRLLLEITAVRVERVQEISEADAVAEGIEKTKCDLGAMCEGCFQGRKAAPHWKDYLGDKKRESIVPARLEKAADSYASLWASINGPRLGAANPWVWVIEFKVIEPAPTSTTKGGQSHE